MCHYENTEDVIHFLPYLDATVDVQYGPLGTTNPSLKPNGASDQNSKHTLCTQTFDFAYWGKFSSQNSTVYVGDEFFLAFKNAFL